MPKTTNNHANEKPPGSFFQNRGRWRWIVRLPGETVRGTRKLCPPGQSASLPATRPEKEAWHIAWRIWEQYQAVDNGDTLTVHALAKLYNEYCQAERYFDDQTNQPTSEARNVEVALRKLAILDRTLSADAVELAHLREIRDSMIEDEYARITVNKYINSIKRMYRWAAGEGYVPGFVSANLSAFPLLEKNKSRARETKPVEPADEESILAVIEVLVPMLRDMVSVQWICDMRPGEVCMLRPGDIDMSDEEVWIYEPMDNKLRRRGKSRYIPIFPEAQKILKPYLKRKKTAFIFPPAEAEKQRRKAMNEARVTPKGYGNGPGTNKKENPEVSPGERYDSKTYARAIRRACDKVNRDRKAKDLPPIQRWSPNQLRHAAATENRALVSREIAAIILGHTKGSNATDVYSWRAAKEEAKRKAKEELRTAAKEVIRAKGAK